MRTYISKAFPSGAVSATATSEPINIEGAEKISLQFIRANHSAGSSTFEVSVSIDGVNYVTFNKLVDNLTNTNAQNLVRLAASSALASNTSKVYSMDLVNDTYKFMKVTATIATDGNGQAFVMMNKNV